MPRQSYPKSMRMQSNEPPWKRDCQRMRFRRSALIAWSKCYPGILANKCCHHPMDLILAISCFVVAILAFMIGFVTEFRQSRKIGPYAIVPTLPWAVGAGLFVGFAL